jgi:hypothetical protein
MSPMPRVLIAFAAALVAAVAVAPAAQARVPERFFGAMWDREATKAPEAEQDAQWALMAQSGVKTVRTVFWWSRAQFTAGQPFDFDETDRIVARAARHDLNLLPLVMNTPEWARLVPGEFGSPPERVSDYTAYLRALVLRYGPAGSFWDEHPELPRRPQREWQIWNEPHLNFYWSTKGRGKNAWVPEYARLLKASKQTIKAIDPGATIVLAGLADFAWDHLDHLNRFKIRRLFDVAALNLFTGRPRLLIKGVYKFRRALRRGREGRKPLWVTETTWPAGKGRVPVPDPLWQRAWYTTDAGMASRLRGAYRLGARFSARLRIGRMYWYTWSSAYRDGDLFDYTGLNRYQGGEFEPRPALAAYSAVARRLGR